MKALIVDDVEMNRELIAIFLEGRGTSVFAESGEQALLLVEDALQTDAYFDLICMDISMPGMDGHEALKKIREAEELSGGKRATVFMVTGSSSPDDMFDALINGGCDDYLTKPLMQQSFSDLLVKHGVC
ncbi:MAG: response regulator [Desulfuromonadaceae bacterium]|nr:response regulator [Desulfuromonadaceae bacterium]MDD2849758.1 response regulator [Desulfuromonadaceae bacterium]MDD4130742.1 response regulator [Desulfuromonadaceae bacterium]